MSMQLLTWISTYVLILLAELGDKTQVAVLLITSNNPTKRWSIFIASALALSLCVWVEVTVGVTLARHVGPHIINKVAGAVFLILGLVGLFSNLNFSYQERLKKDGASAIRPEVAEQAN